MDDKGSCKELISGLWYEYLKLEEIDGEVDLFDLGANSLMVLSIQGRLSDLLQLDVPTQKLMEDCTLDGWEKVYSEVRA